MNENGSLNPVVLDEITTKIHVLRNERVILDVDLAEIYGISTKRLNQQVRRNIVRFPQDFAFELTVEESVNLRLQFATSNSSWGGKRYRSLAFTEHGAIMAAQVLRTPRAVKMSILVVRAFVSLRRTAAGMKELSLRLDELEEKVGTHDSSIVEIIEMLRQLLLPQPGMERKIGF